jgi:hypothetical protein
MADTQRLVRDNLLANPSGLAFAGACAWDGYAAMAVSAAASASLLENRPRPVEIVKRPELYRAGGRRIE